MTSNPYLVMYVESPKHHLLISLAEFTRMECGYILISAVFPLGDSANAILSGSS